MDDKEALKELKGDLKDLAKLFDKQYKYIYGDGERDQPKIIEALNSMTEVKSF